MHQKTKKQTRGAAIQMEIEESLEKNVLEKRRLARLKGEHQVYMWEDVRASIVINLNRKNLNQSI